MPSPRAPGSPWDRFVPGIVLVAFAVLIWNRRWISDDGLIVLRTVRQVLAGHGPVFNAGERVEASTSTLWTYLLALPGLVPGVSLNWAAVALGLVRAPLTAERFRQNPTGAWERTGYRYPRDPAEAARCTPPA